MFVSSFHDRDIHFWLGNDTTHDEKGVAAYKTVELDDSLGGTPVQHRETQEHESALFLSLFKQGIEYLPGGIESGAPRRVHSSRRRRASISAFNGPAFPPGM